MIIKRYFNTQGLLLPITRHQKNTDEIVICTLMDNKNMIKIGEINL